MRASLKTVEVEGIFAVVVFYRSRLTDESREHETELDDWLRVPH